MAEVCALILLSNDGFFLVHAELNERKEVLEAFSASHKYRLYAEGAESSSWRNP